LVELVDSYLEHFHLLHEAISLLIQLLHDLLLLLDGVTEGHEYLFFEENRITFDQVSLVQAVVLQTLHGQVVDVRMAICLRLTRYLMLRLLLLA
jgi:hypothetical protein